LEIGAFCANGSNTGRGAVAKDNFEREMAKHKAFFKRPRVYALIYTDKDLADMDGIFEDMKQYLEPIDEVVQLDFHLLATFFA
jgi:hypothetical protein